MKPVGVCYDDVFSYHVDLEPEAWAASQRLATDEEFERIKVLLVYRQELQDLLKTIHNRKEYDGLAECEVDD